MRSLTFASFWALGGWTSPHSPPPPVAWSLQVPLRRAYNQFSEGNENLNYREIKAWTKQSPNELKIYLYGLNLHKITSNFGATKRTASLYLACSIYWALWILGPLDRWTIGPCRRPLTACRLFTSCCSFAVTLSQLFETLSFSTVLLYHQSTFSR